MADHRFKAPVGRPMKRGTHKLITNTASTKKSQFGQPKELIKNQKDLIEATYIECSELLCSEQQPPIIACFQAGISDEFLNYFWNIWRLDKPSHKPCRIDYNSTTLPASPSVLVLGPSFDQASVERITKLMQDQKDAERHILMLVAGLGVLFEQLGWIKPMIDDQRIKLIKLSVTRHDYVSMRIPDKTPFTTDVLVENLLKSGTNPLAAHQAMSNYSAELLDVVLYRTDGSSLVRSLLRHLWVISFKSLFVCKDWTFADTSFSYLDLADMVGLIRIKSKQRLYADPNESQPSFDTTLDEVNKERWWIIWPGNLKKRFLLCEPMATTLLPGFGLVAQTAMEYFAAQNLTLQFNGQRVLLGERFPFLRNSFVDKFELSSEQPIILPKILASDSSKLAWPGAELPRPLADILEVNRSDFKKIVDIMKRGQTYVFRPQSHSPDIMTVYRSYKQSEEYTHILAFQLKAGKDSINVLDMIRELGKSPLADTQSEPGYAKVLFPNVPTNGYYKLTFVLAAMNATEIEADIKSRNIAEGTSVATEYLRCSKSSWKHLPHDVEVIILLRAGLIQLLGHDNYEFLEKYCNATEFPSNNGRTVVALHHNVIDLEVVTEFMHGDEEEEAGMLEPEPSELAEPYLDQVQVLKAITGVPKQHLRAYMTDIRAAFNSTTKKLSAKVRCSSSNAASSASPGANESQKRNYNEAFEEGDLKNNKRAKKGAVRE